MNGMPFGEMTKNPWRDKAEIPYPKTVTLIPIAMMYLLSALVPVFFGIEIFSVIALIGLVAGVFYLVRIPRVLLPILLISLIPVLLFQSFSLSALMLSVIVGVACGAYLITATKSPWRLLVLPAIAWTVVFVITRDAVISCLALATLPAILALSVSTLTDQRRTASVCYTLFGLLLSVLVIFGVYLITVYGSADRDVIVEHFANQRKWIVDTFMEWKAETLALMAEQGLQENPLYQMTEKTMTRELFDGLVAAVYNILPALVTICCSVAAFEAQSMLCGAYFSTGMKKMLTPSSIAFTMSLVSAILYLVGFFITLFIPGEGMLFAAVENLYLMLLPGFWLVGYSAMSYRIRSAKGKSKLFYIVLIVLIISCNPALLLVALIMLLPLIGANSVVLAEIGIRMMKRMQDKTNNGEGGFGAFTPPSGNDFQEATPEEDEPKEAEESEEPKEPEEPKAPKPSDGDGRSDEDQ